MRVSAVGLGRVFNSWRLVERIGSGGMGEVWKAVHTHLDDSVAAIKVLQPTLADDESFRERFFAEAKIQHKIKHPNVARLLDANIAPDGVPWMAIEYLEGMDGATLLEQQGRLDPARALEIVSEIADGLHAIHLAGTIHRDLKPPNVMLTKPADDGRSRVVILDLGTAKIVEGGGSALRPSTQAGMFVGTVTFAAPEQISCEPVSYPADIFTLGMMAYMFVSGVHPFVGSDPSPAARDLALRAVLAMYNPIAKLLPDLPLVFDIDMLLASAMQRDPAERPTAARLAAKARELSARLRVATGRPAAAAVLRSIDSGVRAAMPTTEAAAPADMAELVARQRAELASSPALLPEPDRPPSGLVPKPDHTGVPAHAVLGGRVSHGPSSPGLGVPVGAGAALPTKPLRLVAPAPVPPSMGPHGSTPDAPSTIRLDDVSDMVAAAAAEALAQRQARGEASPLLESAGQQHREPMPAAPMPPAGGVDRRRLVVMLAVAAAAAVVLALVVATIYRQLEAPAADDPIAVPSRDATQSDDPADDRAAEATAAAPSSEPEPDPGASTADDDAKEPSAEPEGNEPPSATANPAPVGAPPVQPPPARKPWPRPAPKPAAKELPPLPFP